MVIKCGDCGHERDFDFNFLDEVASIMKIAPEEVYKSTILRCFELFRCSACDAERSMLANKHPHRSSQNYRQTICLWRKERLGVSCSRECSACDWHGRGCDGCSCR
jgi:hypothetical protein